MAVSRGETTATGTGADPGARADPGWDEGAWRRDAACRGEDPELFFPIGSAGPALDQVAEARAICARCPVREACLRYALRTGQDYGIWGGLTAEERREVRRRQRVAERELPPAPPGDQRLAG